MRIRPTALALTLAALGAALAAPVAAQPAGPPARTAVYLELLGNGGVYSLNVDRRIGSAAGMRVGLGLWTADDLWASDVRLRMLTVPVQAYVLTNPGGAHHLELGGGLVVGRKEQVNPAADAALVEATFATLTGTLGYRFQRPAGGFVFRTGFTPFYGLTGDEDEAYPEKGFLPSIGLSFGYAF